MKNSIYKNSLKITYWIKIISNLFRLEIMVF